jgi:hypothetical protein
VVFAGMYTLAPNILDALKIVKPETVLPGCLSKQREINSIGGPSPFYPWAADWRQG